MCSNGLWYLSQISHNYWSVLLCNGAICLLCFIRNIFIVVILCISIDAFFVVVCVYFFLPHDLLSTYLLFVYC